MIEITRINKDFLAAKITGSKDGFRTALNTIKEDLPVRSWNKEKRLWHFPLRDLARLSNLCKKRSIELRYGSASIKDAYKKLYARAKLLSSIKSNGQEPFPEMDNLELPLRNFQTVGAKFGYLAGNCVIGDMVGLGKTPQAFSISQHCFDNNEINFVIIVCSSTLKRNWLPETEKFTLWRCCVVEGVRSRRKKVYKSAVAFQSMIINYEILNNDWDLIDEFILQRGFVYHLILDEIQYIKNSQAKRSKFTKKLATRAKRVTGLSATILENTPLDLWSSYHAINKTIYGAENSRGRFMERYIDVDYWGAPTGVVKRTDELRIRKAPTFIRRLKDEVLDELPDRIENDYWIELSSEQRGIYNDIKNRIVTEIKDQEKADKIRIADVLPMMTYLRMAAQSASLLTHKRGASTKLDQLIQLIEDIGYIKLVVFCTFTDMIDIIGKTLTEKKIGNIAIHGKNTPPKARVEQIQCFNDSNEIQVLATSNILGEGVNITSANYLVNFDILYNPAKMEQRIGRIDRLDNEHTTINIINFIATDTIEEYIFNEIYMPKKDLSKDVIDAGKTEERLTWKRIKSLMEL